LARAIRQDACNREPGVLRAGMTYLAIRQGAVGVALYHV
jgi:hypothetical protein